MYDEANGDEKAAQMYEAAAGVYEVVVSLEKRVAMLVKAAEVSKTSDSFKEAAEVSEHLLLSRRLRICTRKQQEYTARWR
jgi:hypothetical protein